MGMLLTRWMIFIKALSTVVARLFLSNSIMKKLLKSSMHTSMKLYSVPFFYFFSSLFEDCHVLKVDVPAVMGMR